MDYRTISLADRVFETLEFNILNGMYKRGEVISETRLSEELGVSRTPIREALNRLMEEDLIIDSPSGTIVLGMTDDDVKDAYEVKRRVEVLASRRAAENISDEQLEALNEIVDQQEYYAQKEDIAKLRDLDTRFHDILYDASGSKVLRRILRPLHHKITRYRRLSLECNGERVLDSVAEHRVIYEAIKDHDADKVETLMLVHIEHAHKSFETVIKNRK